MVAFDASKAPTEGAFLYFMDKLKTSKEASWRGRNTKPQQTLGELRRSRKHHLEPVDIQHIGVRQQHDGVRGTIVLWEVVLPRNSKTRGRYTLSVRI